MKKFHSFLVKENEQVKQAGQTGFNTGQTGSNTGQTGFNTIACLYKCMLILYYFVSRVTLVARKQ